MRVLMAEGPTSAKACRWEKVWRVLGRVELGQRGYGSVSLGDCWLKGNGTCLCQIMPRRCPRIRRHRAVWEPGRGKHLCASSTGLDSHPSPPLTFLLFLIILQPQPRLHRTFISSSRVSQFSDFKLKLF